MPIAQTACDWVQAFPSWLTGLPVSHFSGRRFSAQLVAGFLKQLPCVRTAHETRWQGMDAEHASI